MTDAMRMRNRGKGVGQRRERGTATLELAILLPLILAILFAIVDIGRLLDARFAVAKLAQQGALLGSRDLPTTGTPPAFSPAALITLLQQASGPLKLATSGKIYFWRIAAGMNGVNPAIVSSLSASGGSLGVSSSLGTSYPFAGLSTGSTDPTNVPTNLGDYLKCGSNPCMAVIRQLTVVEVFYRYQLITPLARFIPGLPLDSGGGFIISSKALFP